MEEISQYTGYHGTFLNSLDDIAKEGFKYKFRNDHWLGQGFYFYDTYQLAHWFITRKAKNEQEICVIEALLSSSAEQILNLDTIDGVTFFYQELAKLVGPATIDVEFSDDDHVNRCWALDALKEFHDLKVIIKTFERDDFPTYAAVNTGLVDKLLPLNVKYKEKQICVTTNDCIKIISTDQPSSRYVTAPKIKLRLNRRRK